MNIRLSSGWWYRAAVVVATAWVVHGFVQALLAACVTAVASWPLYRRFSARAAPHVGRHAAAVLFTLAMVVFVLAPMVFAFGALLTQAHALLLEVAAADRTGITAPSWLADLPLVGPWAAARWQHELAHPGALMMWTQRTEPAALLAWAQSLGQFMGRHALIVGFTVLLLFVLYEEGEGLARDLRRMLRNAVGKRAEDYVDLATRAVRASVNSMLVVGLVDGVASAAAFALAGAPHAALWGAITGALAIVPFLGYAAVAALALQLAMTGAAQAAMLCLALGSVILLFGDKVLRPMVAGNGVRLRFVWVLIGCLGGFEALGLIGLVVGPVVLALARQLWKQRVRDCAVAAGAARASRNADSRAMVR
ncbi:MAG: AI-2E family transporter [Burkholderiales bacterium]